MPALSPSPSLPGKSIRSCSKRDTDPRTDTPCDLMGILVAFLLYSISSIQQSLCMLHLSKAFGFAGKKELKIGSRNERKSPHGLMGERDGGRETEEGGGRLLQLEIV